MQVQSQPSATSSIKGFVPVAAAIASGVLLGAAFPPLAWKGLAWIGLAPLALAVRKASSVRRAFLLGMLGGFAFFLITLHPLMSASAWTGWTYESREAFALRLGKQVWFLHFLWILFAAWGSVFWGAWASGLRAFARDLCWSSLSWGVALWVVICEWLRAQTTFGFTWAFLGYAAADLAEIRQLAALGGVTALSALIICVNIAIASAACAHHAWWHWRNPSLAVLLLLACLWGFGHGRLALRERGDIPVAVLQHYQRTYRHEDFTPTGFDRAYLPMIERAVKEHAKLIMLPESIQLGAVSLDATSSPKRPAHRHIAPNAWGENVRQLLRDSEATLIVGLDTVEKADEHNTLVAWNQNGIAGWYHKQKLVPFSEYWPFGWRWFGIRGKSHYRAGSGSQLMKAQGFLIGSFICQEVLFPAVTRASVRDGAELLVTGGNDGVFRNPAVARFHADAAQTRAVETGRYLIRAMKTGISAVIDPAGRERIKSEWTRDAILFGTASPQSGKTPYVRFGDWITWLSFMFIALALARRAFHRERNNLL